MAEKSESKTFPKSHFMLSMKQTPEWEFSDGESGNINPRRFKITANTGRPMSHPWFDRVVLDLDSLVIPRRDIPVLQEHDGERKVGFTDKLSVNTEDGIVAEGPFLKTESAEEVLSLADQKFPWQASVFVPPERVEMLDQGMSAKVNGFEFEGPGAIFRGSQLGEVSFVTKGADMMTSASAFSDGDSVTVDVVSFGGEQEMKDEEKKEEEKTEEPKVEEPKEEAPKTEEAPAAGEDAAALSAKAERDRCFSIFSEAKTLGIPGEAGKLIESGVSFGAAQISLRDLKLSAIQEEAPAPVEPTVPENTPATPEVSFEDRTAAEFAASEDLQATFRKVEIYQSYLRAKNGGNARVFGQEE